MLQELKAPEERFLQSALCDLGYPSIWHGQKSFAILSALMRRLMLICGVGRYRATMRRCGSSLATRRFDAEPQSHDVPGRAPCVPTHLHLNHCLADKVCGELFQLTVLAATAIDPDRTGSPITFGLARNTGPGAR